MQDNQIMTVKLQKIEDMCHALRECEYLSDKIDENYEISFEYVIASLFPNIYDNIINELKRQYTLGYIEGQKSNQEKI